MKREAEAKHIGRAATQTLLRDQLCVNMSRRLGQRLTRPGCTASELLSLAQPGQTALYTTGGSHISGKQLMLVNSHTKHTQAESLTRGG
jgi:hypothetical protein